MRMNLSVAEMSELRQWLASGHAAEIRRNAGFSRAALARDIGTDESTICRWETGSRRPCGLYAAAYYQLLARLARLTATQRPSGTQRSRDVLAS